MNGDVLISPTPNIVVQILQPAANVTVTKDDRNIEVATFGIQGPRGNAMLSGFGLPTSGLGINLDLYLDLSTGYIYRKESGVWIFRVATVPQSKTYIITEEEITSKRIILDIAPMVPSSVTFKFINGTSQVYGEQYEINGNILSWDGYSLDGFIEEGDLVSIGY